MSTPTRRWVTVSAFAKECNCTDALVYQSIKDQQIAFTKTPNGRLMIDANSQKQPFLSYHPKAVQRILENKRILQENENKQNEQIHAIMEASTTDANPQAQYIPTVGEGIALSKARKERALARKAELEAAEREGNLVDLQTTIRVWKTIAIQTRQAIMSIPDRLAPVMAGERDPHKCHRLLTEELTHSLQTLSQNLRDVLLKETAQEDEVEIEDVTDRETANNPE
jgi:phage terminase Nu1 subunit (DNA packaging protein)